MTQPNTELGGYERQGRIVADSVRTPLGFQFINTLSASIGLEVPDGATHAVIQVETQSVRWRDDGTPPTAAVGMPLSVDSLGFGQRFTYFGDLSAIRFIEQAGGAKLTIAYYMV